MNAATYPEVVALARPDPALIQSAEQFLAVAQSSYALIATADQAEAAGEDLKSIKGRQKALEEARTKITKPLLEAQRAVNALFEGPKNLLAEAESIIKRGILTYQDGEERKRRAAEAAASEAARKEREKLEAQAAKAAAAGRIERAEALQATAAAIPQHIEIASAATRVSGLASRATWKAVVRDKMALRKFVAENAEWAHLVEDNMTALHGLARSQKGSLNIPGVEAVEERQLSARAA